MSATPSRHAMLRADIAAMCGALRPASVGCFDLPDIDLVPIDTLVRGGAETWFVDSQAGRVEDMLGRHIGRVVGGQPCLACDPRLHGADVCASHEHVASEADVSCRTLMAIPRAPTHCRHYAPGRRLRVINGDAMRGRSAGFSTRVETVVAAAPTPEAAVAEALLACERTAELDVPLPIADGAFELVISMLAMPRMLGQSYGYFDRLMARRFGRWTAEAGSRLSAVIEQLRVALLRKQLEAFGRELARVTHPLTGRLYLATLVESSDDGWLMHTGVGLSFEVLATWFAFDFESFAPEAFMRRCDDASVVQSAVLRRKRITQEAR